MRCLLPWALAFPLWFVGCADSEGPDTSREPRCVNGECGACVTADDCPAEASCVEGVCTLSPPLEPDLDCGIGACAPDAASSCRRNGDCPEGQACDPELRECVPVAGRPCEGLADCLLGEACVDGLCAPERPPVALDAAVLDATVPDATAPDAALPDAEAPDAVVPDAEIPDAEASDAAAPDAEIPDMAAPDALVTDATVTGPDVAVPDAEIPDAAVPDAEIPDAQTPDAQIPDMATPDMEIPDAEIPDAEIPDQGLPDAFVEQPTPPAGAYDYTRLPVGGLNELHTVEFHPSGDYAVALERGARLQIIDWPTRQAAVEILGAGLALKDVAFTPDGAGALIVASDEDAGAGVVLWLDDALWRAGLPALSEIGRIDGVSFEAVEIPPPWRAEWSLPIILARAGARGDFAQLHTFDPEGGPDGLGAFVGPVPQQFSGTRCDDLAFAEDEFGGLGVLVVCGEGGAEVLFHTVLGGVGEWRINPGNNNLGNTSRAAAWPGSRYALVVSWSGRAVYRFEAGQLNAYGDAPRFSTQGIYGVAFQPDGRRALIVGRAGVNPVRGTVYEYRHDAYRCDAFGCDLTDVSIPGFDGPPYNADSNTYLYDAAFHPHCDGGLIVGGYTNWQASTGQLIEFALEGGAACP